MLQQPLQTWIETHIVRASAPPVLFVSGAQGVGKSTAVAACAEGSAHRIAALGVDDFYLDHEDRHRLAAEVHPLFATRGPPGTHDLPLLHESLDALVNASPSTQTRLPRFDKARDRRAPRGDYATFDGRPDAIVVEGWLMGVNPDAAAPLAAPLNAVEARDPEGHWRAYQEVQLSDPYARLWDRADAFFHIDVPDFSVVRDWRIEQEETTLGLPKGTLPDDHRSWVETFILHYERLTRRMLEGHRRPGEVARVDAHRQPLPAAEGV